MIYGPVIAFIQKRHRCTLQISHIIQRRSKKAIARKSPSKIDGVHILGYEEVFLQLSSAQFSFLLNIIQTAALESWRK